MKSLPVRPSNFTDPGLHRKDLKVWFISLSYTLVAGAVLTLGTFVTVFVCVMGLVVCGAVAVLGLTAAGPSAVCLLTLIGQKMVKKVQGWQRTHQQ